MGGEIGSLIYLLVYLLVACLIIYLVFWALGRSKLGDPWRTIVTVIVILVMLMFALRFLGML